MTLAFAASWLFSVLDFSTRGNQERDRYREQFVRSMTGIGASGAHNE